MLRTCSQTCSHFLIIFHCVLFYSYKQWLKTELYFVCTILLSNSKIHNKSKPLVVQIGEIAKFTCKNKLHNNIDNADAFRNSIKKQYIIKKNKQG